MSRALGADAAGSVGASAASLADGALLARLAARDSAAFALLYDRHAPLVFGAAIRLLGDRLAAERAVEEAFLALWHQGAGIDQTRTTARAWLLALVCRYVPAHQRAAWPSST